MLRDKIEKATKAVGQAWQACPFESSGPDQFEVWRDHCWAKVDDLIALYGAYKLRVCRYGSETYAEAVAHQADIEVAEIEQMMIRLEHTVWGNLAGEPIGDSTPWLN